MNKSDCVREKISSRTVGLILLPFAFLIAFAGFMVIPVLGIIFALPVLGLAVMLIAAPPEQSLPTDYRKNWLKVVSCRGWRIITDIYYHFNQRLLISIDQEPLY